MKKKLGINKITKSLKKESQLLKKEVSAKTLGYIMAGFGVVAGLAWNDAIKAMINYAFPAEERGGVAAQFAYAIVLTFAVVVVSVYLSRFFESKETETDEEE